MCGKFTQMASWREVHDFSDLLQARIDDEVRVFTPMRAVPVVHLDGNGDRVVTPMTWGFTDRTAEGRRIPRHIHARGETVHQLRTFREAFHARRGVTFVKTFNEGREIPTMKSGAPAGRTRTEQWTLRPRDGKPAIIGVIYDRFDVGRGAEYEFVQITVSANQLIATITDRMPLLLDEDDLSLWLGEDRAPIDDVLELVRTREMGPEWEMGVENAG